MTTNDSRRSADLPPPPASSLPLSGDHLGHQQQVGDAGGHGDHAAHGGHGWMMIVCCIPMLIIAIVLVATNVVGVGFLFVALMCTAMMAMMMRGMNHGGD